MRTLSSSIPLQGRESFWKCRSSQLGLILHWGEAHEPDGVNAQLRAREEDKHVASSGGC